MQETLQQFIDAVASHLHDKWVSFVTAGLFMALGWFFGKRRARANWKKKEFFDRLNVSLNIVRDGTLSIRTIIEKASSEIFLNSVAVETITRLALKTTEKDSLLPLPKEEYWFYLNSVLNEVAEKFSEGQIKRDLGLPTTSAKYLLCLTSECAGAMKTRKVRAMLIQKQLLEHLPSEQPKLESPHHSIRWQTLKQLAAEYAKNPDKFLEIEIAV